MTTTTDLASVLRTRDAEAVDPADWGYVDSFDSRPEPGSYVGTGATFTFDGQEVFGTNWLNAHDSWLKGKLRASSVSRWDESGQCDHCGAHLRYVAVLTHLPTGDAFAVGETCLDTRFDFADRAARDLRKLREAAAEARERARRSAEATFRRAWYIEWADNAVEHAAVAAYLDAAPARDAFLSDLNVKLNQYGYLTERQTAAVVRNIERDAQRAADDLAHPPAPVVEGKGVVVEGEVLSVKWQENAYGGRQVMTVRDDRGFKVWGSVPTIYVEVPDPYRAADDETTTTTIAWSPERGERVRFTANVEVSDRDETFGFFKRPRKGEVLS